MKKRFYIKTALVSLTAMMLLSSCLKDTAHLVDFSNIQPVCDFPLVAMSSTGALNTATLSSAGPATQSINAELTIGAAKDGTTAIPVTIAVDAASMTATYGTTYTLLPASTYTASTLTANIVPGIQTRIAPTLPIVGAPVALPTSLGSVSFAVNVAAVKALPPATYMLPLTITSAPGAVIDQYHTLYYKIVVGP